MWESWWLFAAAALILVCLAAAIPWIRHQLRERALRRARKAFHRQREWLEARFMTLAAQSGKPRGLRWVDCDFENPVAFARDRQTGGLRALVGVTIRFEAVEGGGMEHVEAVDNAKAATVVFRLDGPQWEPDDRAYFNLSPAETIKRYERELETVD